MRNLVVLHVNRAVAAVRALCATAHNLHSGAYGKLRGGRVYWAGRVLGKGGKAIGGESFGSVVQHGVNPPKAARFALGVDHRGAYIKAHQRGAFGPDSFVLTAGE